MGRAPGNEEKERRATECYQKAENIKRQIWCRRASFYREAAELGAPEGEPIWLVLPERHRW